MKISKEVLKGHVDTMMLSIVNTKDCYGYEIAKKIKEICEEKFEVKEGTMYLALKRLEKNGLIESYWNDEEESGGGRRKYYKLTARGKKELLNKKEEWLFMAQIMNRFLS